MNDLYYFNGELYKISKLEEDIKFDIPPTSEGLLVTTEILNRMRYVQGRILTVIDAVIVDKEQKKAVKDLLKHIINIELNRLSDSATGFKTLEEGDMVQFSGSEEKFYEENVDSLTRER